MDRMQNYLERLGLPEKEAAVYLALLQLGQASVQTIARRAHVVRPTAYVILDALIHKGLVQKGLVGKKTVFMTSAPEELEDLISRQESHLKDQRDDLKILLPELKAIYALSEERPSIRLFEGREGLKNLQREFIEISKEPVYSIGSFEVMEELFPINSVEYNKEVRGIRVKAGIKTYHIYPVGSNEAYFSKEEDKEALRESRFLPQEQFNLTAHFSLHGPLISIVTFRKKVIGVLIEHSDIASSLRAIFDILWKSAREHEEVKVEKAKTPNS